MQAKMYARSIYALRKGDIYTYILLAGFFLFCPLQSLVYLFKLKRKGSIYHHYSFNYDTYDTTMT